MRTEYFTLKIEFLRTVLLTLTVLGDRIELLKTEFLTLTLSTE